MKEYTMLLQGPLLLILIGGLILADAFSSTEWEKPGKGIRAACFLTGLATGLLMDYLLVDVSTASTALEAPICLTMVFLYLRFGCGEAGIVAFQDTVWCFLLSDLLVQIVFQIGSVFAPMNVPAAAPVRFLLLGASLALLCFTLRRSFFRWLRRSGERKPGGRNALFSALVLLIYLLGANFQFIVWLMDYVPEGASSLITVFRMIVTGICLCLLALQNSIAVRQETELELAMQKNLWRERQNQFELSQENMDLINRKCHDLKHQIAAIRQMKDEGEIDRQMAEMERAVLIYDSSFQTGDETLDVILTEKKLSCEDKHITMTCMAEGQSLSFLNKVDLYTMLGNALDNAIESVSKLEDPEKRVIQIAVYTEGALLMIRIRNYFEGKLDFDGSLPVTTKGEKDYHGYGLKSIRYTAEQYGGTVRIQAEDCYFTLQILIPLEKEKAE